MSTISNGAWELQLNVVISAAELVSALPLARMAEVTEVAQIAPPSLNTSSVFTTVLHAPLNDQLALVAAAINFQETYAALLESQHPTRSTDG